METVVEVKRKSTKNIKRKKTCRHRRHHPFRSYRRLRPLHPTSSNSTVSPTTVTTVMDEKKYDLNICLFHLRNSEMFQAISNTEWYVKCPFSGECGVFAHRTMQNSYMGALNRKVHDTYRKLKGTVMCECNTQASLNVSNSPSNPGRPFFVCCNKDGC